MFRSHTTLNNGLRDGVPVRRQRSAKVCDENTAPNRSIANQARSHQLAGSNRRTSSLHVAARQRRSDENAAPKNRITANQAVSPSLALNHGTSGVCRPRRALECGNATSAQAVPLVQTMPRCEACSQDSTSSRAFRDITNVAMENCVSGDKEKNKGEVASQFLRLSHASIHVSGSQESKKRRQLPVSSFDGSVRRRLPSAVIATILEMAGFKCERPEFEYADANLKSDLQREFKVMPRRGFMSEQRSLNSRMRAILIDWVAQVLDMSRLSRRTFFLTVGLVDRCLSCMQVDRSNLQLLGSTAFLIAAKVEEIYPPEVSNLVHICDGAYTTEQLLQMECTILQALDFCVDGPTVEHFLPHFIAVGQSRSNLGPDPILSNGLASLWHFSAASDSDQRRNSVAWYLAEIALLDNHMSQYPPSQLSASALYLANHLIKQPSPGGVYTEDAILWDDSLAQVSGYTEPMLLGCAGDLDRLRTAALSDTLQQINRRHIGAVNAIRHAIFRPSNNGSGSLPYAVVASAVPFPY